MDDEAPCPYVHVCDARTASEMLVAAGGDCVWSSGPLDEHSLSSDELWVRFKDGSDVTEYGPLPPSTTAYEWQVPNVSAVSATIEIGAWDPTGYRWHALDSSDEPFTVVGLADLVHQELGLAQPVYPGGVVGLTRKVRNAGVVPVQNFSEHLALSPDDVCTADDPVFDALSIDDLQPGEVDESVYVVQIPPDIAPGLHYLCLILDPSDLVPEYDEANNASSRAVEILDPTLFTCDFESGTTSAWSSTMP